MFKRIALVAVALVAGVSFAKDRTAGLAVEDVKWRLVGPGGAGWIESLCASKYDKERFYVGCDVGGFYYTEDGGRSYKISNKGLKNIFVETIAEHPSNENILFLGSSGGIYKSIDRGKTWVEKRNGLPPIREHEHTIQVTKYAFDPKDENIMYAVSGTTRRRPQIGGVFKSVDGGETWGFCAETNQLPKDVAVEDIAIHPTDSNRILISTSTHGVFLSTDAGKKWKNVNTGLITLRTLKLAQSPSHPNIVYLTVKQVPGTEPWCGGVYRSDDGGETWTAKNKGLPVRIGKKGAYSMTVSWHRGVCVHPKNPDIVYLGGTAWVNAGVYKTTNGGESWQRCFSRDNNKGWITFSGPAAWSLVMSPIDPNIIMFGTSGQIHRTEDGGLTWDQRYSEPRTDGKIKGTGLEVTCLHNVQADPTTKGRFYLSYYDIGLMVTDDNGDTMRPLKKGLASRHWANCFGVLQDPLDNKHLWATFGQWYTNEGAFYETFDGGETWVGHTNKLNGCVEAGCTPPVLVNDKPPYTLAYVANGHGVMISRDGGKTWSTIDTGSMKRAQKICADGGVLYVGTCCTKEENAEVWKSADAGKTWEKLVDQNYHLGDVKSISAKGNRILVGTRGNWSHKMGYQRIGGGHYSTDGGKTWNHVFKDKWCGTTFITDDSIFLSLNDNTYHDHSHCGGLIRSRDDGKTWTSLNSESLTHRGISSMCLDPFDKDIMWIGTGGNSAFVGRIGK